MRQVLLTVSEMFPVYAIADEGDDYGHKTVEVDEALVERYRKAWTEFITVQKLLEKAWGEGAPV